MIVTVPIVLIVLFGMTALFVLDCYLFRRSMISLFRYRLWEVRDNTVDAMLAGEIPSIELIREHVETVESFIENADEITLLRWLTLPEMPSEYLAQKKMEWESGLAEMTEAQRKLFLKHHQALINTIYFHLMLRSVSGWIILATATVFIVVAAPVVAIVQAAKSVRKPLRECAAFIKRKIASMFETNREILKQKVATEDRMISFVKTYPSQGLLVGTSPTLQVCVG
jgi:hypothetical protein